MGVPLLLLAACGSGQTTGGTGGSGMTGTGGVGGKGSGGAGAVGGGGGVGGSGAAGKGGTGGSSTGGVGGGGTAGAGGRNGSGGAGGGTAGAGGRDGSGGAGGGAAGGGGAGGGAGGGTAGAGGAGGSSCATATSGATCTSEGMTCGGPCTDICQFCNLLRCTSGHWQAMEAAPAPCFMCGDSKCQTMTQYCKTTEGGVAGSSPSHACVAIPAACQTTRTCACLSQNSVTGMCTMGSNGELMTLLQVP